MNGLSLAVGFNDIIADFLGCDINVVNLYLEILRGPKNKHDIISIFDNDEGVINGYLDILFSYRLVADFMGRDKVLVYFAVDPQFSFPAIILSEMWAIDSDLHTIGDLIKRKELKELNDRYKKSQIIVKNLVAYYKKQLPFLKEMVVVISGYKRIGCYLSELLETAENEIVAVLSPPHLLGEIVWQTVVDKMSQGVVYQRITTFDELIRHGYRIYKNEISSYNEVLYISRNNVLSDKFYVINDITVVFFIPDRQNKGFKYEVQIINNAGFSKRYKDIYEKMRLESVALSDIMQNIDDYRDDYLKKASKYLTADECGWVMDVFDYGVFCKHQEYSAEIVDQAKTKSLSNGLVEINNSGEILPIYNMQGVLGL